MVSVYAFHWDLQGFFLRYTPAACKRTRTRVQGTMGTEIYLNFSQLMFPVTRPQNCPHFLVQSSRDFRTKLVEFYLLMLQRVQIHIAQCMRCSKNATFQRDSDTDMVFFCRIKSVPLEPLTATLSLISSQQIKPETLQRWVGWIDKFVYLAKLLRKHRHGSKSASAFCRLDVWSSSLEPRRLRSGFRWLTPLRSANQYMASRVQVCNSDMGRSLALANLGPRPADEVRIQATKACLD
jgi:hypothetical protein